MSPSISISPSLYYLIHYFLFDFLLLVYLGPCEEFQWQWSCTPSHQDVSKCRQYWGLNVVLDFTLFCCILPCFFPKCLEHVIILSVTDFALLTNPGIWFLIFSHSLYFLISLRILPVPAILLLMKMTYLVRYPNSFSLYTIVSRIFLLDISYDRKFYPSFLLSNSVAFCHVGI